MQDNMHDKEDSAPTTTKACDLCYRSKLKCVGRENPPCQRCVAGGHDCTFDGRRKSKMTLVENRMGELEAQLSDMRAEMHAVQAKLAMLTGSSAPRPLSVEAKPSPILAAHSAYLAGHDLPTSPFASSSTRGSRAHSPRAPLPSLQLTSEAAQYSSLRGITNRALPPPVSVDPSSHHNGTVAVSNGRHSANGSTSAASGGAADDSIDIDDPVAEARAHGPPPPRLLKTERRAGAASEEGRQLKRAREDYPPSAVAHREEEHAYTDPVEAGLVTPARGRQLLDSFFTNCHNSIPIFDPLVDTWESLRARSPLALCCVMMVGARFEHKHGGGSAEMQRKLQDHAEWMAKNSLFGKGDAELETIQAMIVLASWGDSGDTRWRPAGHAFRLAMELSLYRCLPHLVATGMGEGKARIELEAERPLVVGARVWLAICKMEYENSFNHGRPVLISEDTSISLGRRFLKHPLSMRMDSRVVAACEILTNRHRRHLSFAGPPRITVSEAVAEVRKDNSLFEQWFGDWNLYYDHLNIPQGHFLRDILVTGKNHAVLITNARLLYGVRGQRDIAQISPDQREALSRAVQAASQLVHIAITSPGYKDHFMSANSATHVSMVFAARMLIRFATLVPEAINLRNMGREIEELAGMLKRGPCNELAAQIQDVISRARTKHILPARSRAPSPWGHIRDRERQLERHHHPDHRLDRNAPRMDAAYPPPPSWPAEPNALAGTFDLLSDFQFAEEMFNTTSLSDSDAMNIFQWFADTWDEETANLEGYSYWSV